MYRVFGLRLGMVKGFRFPVDKMHTFTVLTEKYLRPYGCCRTNFTAAINCTNPNNEMQYEIFEMEIIEGEISFVIKQMFFRLRVIAF